VTLCLAAAPGGVARLLIRCGRAQPCAGV